MLHPLYYDYPDEDYAYTFSKYRGPGQAIEYAFGDDLIVVPITMPVDNTTKVATFDDIWMPPGERVRCDTGEIFKGPAIV